jgi:Reverse transcriptase (RNA-dependent DNA polymerase)
MSHTMKLWERVIEYRLRKLTTIFKNQFSFMHERSTKRHREQKDLHMIFIDLEKTYDKISRNIMWWALKRKLVLTKYVTLIKDMYTNVVTCVTACDGESDAFPIKIRLHQGLALSPYIFTLDISWCMLFVDDVVLIDENIIRVNQKLELWK